VRFRSRASAARLTGLTPRAAAWLDAGAFTELGGQAIFVRERAGAPDEPAVVLLHGYPSSSFDWRHAFERLPQHRLITFDFLGFGLSDKPRDQLYSLSTQADIAEGIVDRFADGPVVLVAHDMGSSVATELLARDLEGRLRFELVSTLLFNASLVRERASLLWGQKLLLGRFGPLAARLTSEFGFRRQFAGIFSRAHPLSDEEAADQWALLTHRDGHLRLPETIAYVAERERLVDRWHGAVRDWPGALSLAWGLDDPVATTNVLAGLRELRPGVEVSELPGVGHYPQIEAPEQLAGALDRALSFS
jgi:pimeloyl-ACP methyl ester carboxylesterase